VELLFSKIPYTSMCEGVFSGYCLLLGEREGERERETSSFLLAAWAAEAAAAAARRAQLCNGATS